MKKFVYVLITFFAFLVLIIMNLYTYYQDLEKLREINDQLIKSNPKDQGAI